MREETGSGGGREGMTEIAKKSPERWKRLVLGEERENLRGSKRMLTTYKESYEFCI